MKISCQLYIISMMSGHSANLVFFNKKNKNWTSRTLANPPPPTSDNISFLSYPTTRPPPLKVNVICVSHLITVRLEGGSFLFLSCWSSPRFWLLYNLHGCALPCSWLDNVIWFSTPSRMSGLLWHNSKWACRFGHFI